ncbi:MAG TPA: hypothetical protein VHN80_21575 [Kineosporiaceae bacterium]|nr:hypothetical protein [Kineosporiaceae bacterium]
MHGVPDVLVHHVGVDDRSSPTRTRFTLPSTIPIARATSCERWASVTDPVDTKNTTSSAH